MAEFYKVHCSNCGEVVDADKMAINVDELLSAHLSRMIKVYDEQAYRDLLKVTKEIKIGMYLTTFEMVQDNVLDGMGRLRISCQYILDYMKRKYDVELKLAEDSVQANQSQKKNKTEVSSFDDDFSFDDDDFLLDESSDSKSTKKSDGKVKISKEDELKLIYKMKLCNESGDADLKKKKACIENLLMILWNNRDKVVLDCTCDFKKGRDDNGNDFIKSLEVKYISGDFVSYSHMVCPNCGEQFSLYAGQHREHVIVLLGSSRVGKTAYLAAIIDRMLTGNCGTVSVVDGDGKKYVFFREKILQRYQNGQKPIKTPENKESVALFTLKIKVGTDSGEKNALFTFVDLPGEVFVPNRTEEINSGEVDGSFVSNYRRICKYADVFWFCISPKQIDTSLYQLNQSTDKADQVSQDIMNVLSNVHNTLNIMGEEKENTPAAIMITQSDLIKFESDLFREGKIIENSLLAENQKLKSDSLGMYAQNVHSYLNSQNMVRIESQLSDMFNKRNYFALAAYGVEIKTEEERVQKNPSGILPPFIWTLAVLGYIPAVKNEIVGSRNFFKRKSEPEMKLVFVKNEELFFK